MKPFGLLSSFFLLLSAACPLVLPAQEPDRPADSFEEYQARYAERIRLTHIAGIYIPASVEEAMVELERLTNEVNLDAFRQAPEDDVVRKLFFSLGRWMTHNWGFYEGSRLSHALREQGISDPDDMARVLMRCYHRHLNQRPLELEEQAAAIRERIKKEQEERRQNARIIRKEPASGDKED